MRNRVIMFAISAVALGVAASFAIPHRTSADAPTAYYVDGNGTGYANGTSYRPARIVTRTVQKPVIVERVVTKPVYVERVIERRVVVHKRHRGIIPKVYSMIFGG